MKVGNASVKVYRNAHPHTKSGWVYVVAWTTAEGRRRVKFAEEADALKEARTKAEHLNAGHVEAAGMKASERDELVAARRIAKDVPVLAALREWAKCRELTGGNLVAASEAWKARNLVAHTRIKVKDVLREFLDAKAKANRKVGFYHESTHNRILADFGEQFIDSIFAQTIDRWLSGWENPVTRNTYRRRVVSIWRWAQRRGYLPQDRITEAERTETAHEEAPRIGIITAPTWRRLLHHIAEEHPKLVPPLVVAGFCGLRRAEVHAQVWEDIDLAKKVLRVTNAKRGTPARRLVPLSDAAVEWLLACPGKRGPICAAVSYKGRKQSALALDGIRRIGQDAEEPFELPPNCFRHSYISHAVAATGDIPRVSVNAGNSPKEVNRHYRELVTEDEGRAWFEVRPAPAVGAVVNMAGKAVGG